MSVDWRPDLAFDRLNEHSDTIRGAAGSNEATTRLRAIDLVLFDVLGWDRLSADTEKYCRADGFADYVFFQGRSVCLVLEAKKAGTYFVLPDRQYDEHPVGFALLGTECPDASRAMQQAAGYAASLGARYIGISNGHQWLLAIAFVLGQPVGERSVYVFESFDAIVKRFDHFCRCFGPAGLLANFPAGELLESRKAPPPPKLSARIPLYPEPATRNVMVNELGYVLGMVWDELNHDDNDEEFLRECYVHPDASQGSLAIAKELLEQQRRADVLVAHTVVDSSEAPRVIEADAPAKPVIVLGGVGHGKSVFLKYLRLVGAKDTMHGYIQIDVDFLDRPDSKNEVASYVYSCMGSQLFERYGIDLAEDRLVRGVLHSELERFKNTPAGKRHPPGTDDYKDKELAYIEKIQSDTHFYLGRVFRHLKRGRKASVAVFFDNLDRRDDSIQEEAFLKASSMARDWECVVFVCLRPGTFYRSTEAGVLDALAPTTISVLSPDTAVVLRKRFRYAARLARSSEPADAKRPRRLLVTRVSVDLPSVDILMKCCDESMHRNRKLRALFDAVSNGDIRRLLRYAEQFLVSGHLDTKKILDRIATSGDYVMPDHEALRALLYGNFMHYEPRSSVFINLFDISHSDPVEHFVRFLALHYLVRMGTNAPAKGLCRIDEAIQYLCQLGYSGERARRTLEFLLEGKCCEPRLPGTPWNEVRDLRVTPLGRYHVAYLAKRFQYVDAVIVDTPICDSRIRGQVKDVRSIRERLRRAELFIRYLDECAQGVQDADVLHLWRETSEAVCADIAEIRSRL